MFEWVNWMNIVIKLQFLLKYYAQRKKLIKVSLCIFLQLK